MMNFMSKITIEDAIKVYQNQGICCTLVNGKLECEIECEDYCDN
jgi:hypothetical protein